MTLGALSVDLWSLVAHRRELASLADTAAVAAVSAIDESEWRRSGELRLDREAASHLALSVFQASAADDAPSVEFDPDGVTVLVYVTRTVETALLGLAGRDFVVVGASSQATATLHD
jgi:hypothetical protein